MEKNNPDKVKVYNRKAYHQNKQWCLDYHKKWVQLHREQNNKYQRNYYQQNKEKFKNYEKQRKLKQGYLVYINNKNRKKRYSITLEEYEKLLKEQNNICAICGKPETIKLNKKIKQLSIDHNHKTGKIRGLLCSRCNFQLGTLESILENKTWYKLAIKYKEKG